MPRKKKVENITTETKPAKKRTHKKKAETSEKTLRQKHHTENVDPKRFDLDLTDFSDEAILIIKHHNREKKFDPKKLKVLSFGLKAIVFEYSNTLSYVVERKLLAEITQYKLTEIRYDAALQEYVKTELFSGELD